MCVSHFIKQSHFSGTSLLWTLKLNSRLIMGPSPTSIHMHQKLQLWIYEIPENKTESITGTLWKYRAEITEGGFRLKLWPTRRLRIIKTQEPRHGSLLWWVILSCWKDCGQLYQSVYEWEILMFVRSRAEPVPAGCAVTGWETKWEELSRKHHPGKTSLSQKNSSQLQRDRLHIWNTSKYTHL